jgi:hypothetical protein
MSVRAGGAAALAAGVAAELEDAPPVITAAITGRAHAPATADSAAAPGFRADAGSDGARVVTLASSPRPADWGRALSRALERIATEVALRDGVAEADALVDRTVTLHVDPAGHGVRIVVQLLPVPVADVADPEPELDLGIG